MAVADAFHGISREDEEEILSAMVRQDTKELMLLIPRALGEGSAITPESLAAAHKLLSALTPEEVSTLREFSEHPDVAEAMGPTMEALASVDPSHFQILGDALSNIQVRL